MGLESRPIRDRDIRAHVVKLLNYLVVELNNILR
jgi:hypothetical protein